MSRFIAKKVLFLSLLIILSMIVRVSAATNPLLTPPTVPPLPTYCDISNGGVEICDGIDNNCNGQVDENWTTYSSRPLNSNQKGVCLNSKKQCSGVTGWTDFYSTANITNYVATETASYCDGLDNDCDNQVDELCTCTPGQTRSFSCGVGSCARSVSQTCNSGAWSPSCTPLSAGVESGNCNDGLDNDCDGLTDFSDISNCPSNCSIAGSVQSSPVCGVGSCARSVSQTCTVTSTGRYWSPASCTPLAAGVENTAASCADGLDNDCDGLVDCADPNCLNVISESCDGKDNDCDGTVDDGWQTYTARPLNTNQNGVCAGSKKQCSSGAWQNWYATANIANYVANESSTLNCDGLDNDCDGQTDEGCVCINGAKLNVTCGLGICTKTVPQTCNAGVYSPSCTPLSAGVESGNCNDGLDNDCDGLTDFSDISNCPSNCSIAGSVQSSPVCGVGSCARSVSQTCTVTSTGRYWSPASCTPLAAGVESGNCNDGLDNDCDGLTDFSDISNCPSNCSIAGSVQSSPVCGVGSCARSVSQTCTVTSTGRYWSPASCTPLAAGVENTAASCADGLDNDCDGLVDCADPNCLNVISESCDGKDNDCDGSVDDGWQTYTTRPLNSKQQGVCAGSKQQCTLGVWNEWYATANIPSYVSVESSTLNCDGLDNDCDGQTDEGCVCINGAKLNVTCGLGICTKTVPQTCNAGVYSPACTPLAAGVENTAASCADGLDNDCDGLVDCADPNCLNVIPETCDGKDNDCDGQPDDNLVPSSRTCSFGTGACNRTGLEYKTCNGLSGWSTTYSGCTATVVNPISESCNGLDDNCDGFVDNGLTPSSRACTAGIGACQRSGFENQTCNGLSGWSSTYSGCTAKAANPTAESCDAIDNDCDSVNNDGLPNINEGHYCITGRVGVCADGTQYQYCDSSVTEYTWSTCLQTIPSSPEICDGLDNDCNGQTDEGWQSFTDRPLNSNLKGVCAGSRKQCSGIIGWQDLYNSSNTINSPYMAYYVPVETNANCDGLDNDCDGTVDEGCACITGETKLCGLTVGACVQGTQVCSGGVWGLCLGGVSATSEVCDAFDNDCDGTKNNDLANNNTGTSCTVSGLLGVCSNGTRYQYCNASVDTWNWSICTQTTLSSSEICDGLDNDCNGQIDENWTNYSNRPLNNNQNGVCAGSKKICAGTSGWQDWYNSTNVTSVPNYVEVESNITNCDGLDNDCDGTVDEGCICVLGINRNFTCGLGTCQRTVLQVCNGSSWGPECINGTPSVEICNSLDDNCNGQIDENVCSGSGGGSGGSGDLGGDTSSNGADSSSAGGNTNNGGASPIIETPGNINDENNYNQTAAPPLDNVKNFSKTNRILIVLAILIVIGGVLAFVLIERYREKEEEVVPANTASPNVNPQQPNFGNTNNYGTANYKAMATNKFNDPDAPAINYVFVMRQKGFKDEAIIGNLRSKGWNEALLRRLFK